MALATLQLSAENGTLQIMSPEQSTFSFVSTTPQTAPVPSEWLTSPFFVCGVQPNHRSVVARNRVWTLGVNNPLTGSASVGITLNHIELLFALLSFRDLHDGAEITLSFRDIMRRMRCSNNALEFSLMRQRLEDLRNYWIQVEYPHPRTDRLCFAFIHGIAIREETIKGKNACFLDQVVLHREFVSLLQDLPLTMRIRVDVFCGLRGDMARAMYLFLPSRAVHHLDPKAPFEITFTKLLEQLNLPVPSAKWMRMRSLRKAIAALDSVSILNGVLRVSVAETAADYKLQLWVEKESERKSLADNVIAKKGSLVSAYLRSGRTQEDLRKKLGSPEQIEDHEREKLARLGINLEKNRVYLEIAKTLLGPDRFFYLLSEMKGEFETGSKARNPFALLQYRVTSCLSTLPSKRAEG